MRASARGLHLLQFFLAGVTLVILTLGSLAPFSYNRDLSQDYLSARALRDGRDVFTRTTDLSVDYFPDRATHMTHPNPHPPFLVVLMLPLSFVPYEVVYPLGLAVNVLLLILVGRWLGFSWTGRLALAAWPPIWWVLFQDQFEIALLVLAMLGWRAASSGHPSRAGFLLGLAATLKFYPLLLLVPFLARRQVRVLVAAALVLMDAQIVSTLTFGPAAMARYYTEVLPEVASRYSTLAINMSPYGALLRLFGGSTDVSPAIDAPGLARPLATLFSVFGLVALFRLHPQGAPLAMLITLPAAWGYQVVLALPEIVRLLRQSRWRAGTLAAAAAASFVQPPLLYYVNEVVSRLSGWTGDRAPPILGFFGAIQTIGFLALLVLSLRVNGAREPSASAKPSDVGPDAYNSQTP